MKYKITNNTRCNGKPVRVGDVLDLTERVGNILIGSGKAVEYVEPAEPVEPEVEPEGEPEVEMKPKKRGRPKKDAK